MILYEPWFENRRRHRSLGDCVRKILRRKNLPDQNTVCGALSRCWKGSSLKKLQYKRCMSFACRPLFQSLQNLCWDWILRGLGSWCAKMAWTYKGPKLGGLLWRGLYFTFTWRAVRWRRSTSANWTNYVSKTRKHGFNHCASAQRLEHNSSYPVFVFYSNSARQWSHGSGGERQVRTDHLRADWQIILTVWNPFKD